MFPTIYQFKGDKPSVCATNNESLYANKVEQFVNINLCENN